MPTKQGDSESKRIEFAAEDKLVAYIDMLLEKEGFGNSRGEVARNFVWKEINRLIEAGRLKEIDSEESPAAPSTPCCPNAVVPSRLAPRAFPTALPQALGNRRGDFVASAHSRLENADRIGKPPGAVGSSCLRRRS
jgi:hypothetical protein